MNTAAGEDTGHHEAHSRFDHGTGPEPRLYRTPRDPAEPTRYADLARAIPCELPAARAQFPDKPAKDWAGSSPSGAAS
jgi:hypothetical protein